MKNDPEPKPRHRGHAAFERDPYAPKVSFRKQLRFMRLLVLILLTLVVLAAAAVFFFSMDERVTGRGIVVGLRTYELKSSVQSRITAIHFKEGDQVKAGDLLLEMDNRPLKQALERQAALVRELEQEIEVKKWGIELLKLDPLPEEYRHTRIALEESRASVANAESELETYGKLFERKVISEVEFHRRELDALRAKAELERFEADFAKLESGLADRIVTQAESELALLQVRLDNCRDELVRLEADASEYRFVAPEDGSISYIPSKLGSYVEPGEVMVNLAAGGGRKFIAFIDESEIHKVGEAQQVRISSSQYSTYEYGWFYGEVLYIGELPEERAGRIVYPVFILVTQEPMPLRVGSTGEAKITVGRSRIILTLTGMN